MKNCTHAPSVLMTVISCVQYIPGHISVDRAGDILQQCAESYVEIEQRFALLDTAGEQLAEVLEGILVHRVHLSQHNHHKVHHRDTRGNLAILFTRCRYLPAGLRQVSLRFDLK